MQDGNAVVDLNAERLARALDAGVNKFERRKKALRFATRYCSGTRYVGAERVNQVAGQFCEFISGARSNDRSVEAASARETALGIAIEHLCKPSSTVSVEKVLIAAKTFENFLTLEGV